MSTPTTRPNTNNNGSPYDAEALRQAMAAIEEKRRMEQMLYETNNSTPMPPRKEGV